MQHQRPRMRRAAMLEHVDALPRPERRTPLDYRNRQTHLGQRRPQMSGHIVGAFVVMLVPPAFRRNPREVAFEIAPRGRSAILLDHERRRGVADEYRQQPGIDPAIGNPAANGIGAVVQSLPRRPDRQPRDFLPHGMGLPQTPGQG